MGFSCEDGFEIVHPLDAGGVEIEELFEGPGLRLAITALQIAEGRFGDSGQLHDLHLSEHGTLAKALESFCRKL